MATSKDLLSAPDLTSARETASIVRKFFADSASFIRCISLDFPAPKARLMLFPTARQTLGEDTTCTLENFPSFVISFTARRRTPEPHTTE
jgi:hypothetical protein